MSSPVPLLPPAVSLTGSELLYAVQNQNNIPTDVQVTASQLAGLGGSNASFIVTLTAPLTLYVSPTGNDMHDGSTPAKAFQTLNRARTELGKYNFSQGWPVTINVADGTYNEQLMLTTLVGTFQGQITWVGNVTTRANVHIFPQTQSGTNFTQFAVISSDGEIGHAFHGFWLDSTAPAFGAWQPVATVDKSVLSLDKCRLSLPDDAGWILYENNRGSVINVNEVTYDWGGNQTAYLDGTSDSLLNVFNTQTLNPNVGNPTWGAHIVTNTAININIAGSSWVGWTITGGSHGTGGLAGGAFNSTVTALFADLAELPSNAFLTFTNTGNFGGATEKTGVGPASYVGFGAPLGTSLNLTAGAAGDLAFCNTWAIFNCGTGDGVHNHFQLFYNDAGTDTTISAAGTGRHVVLTNILSDYNYQTPLTGATITMNYHDNTLIIDPAGAIATLTVILPYPAFDGQRVWIESSEAIGVLTVFGGAGDLTKNAPIFLQAGRGFWARYRSAITTWFCSLSS